MSPSVYLTIYCLLIVAASLVGGLASLWMRLTHRGMQVIISAIAGFMLGIALLHLLPHAVTEDLRLDRTMLWLLGGFLVMFFVERFFCFHHHETPQEASEHAHQADSCDHHHAHDLSWTGAAVGLTIHSTIAGISLAAAAQPGSPGLAHGALPGLAVFLVIILHKPLDSLTLGTLMAGADWTPAARHLVNFLFAMTIPMGVGLFHLGVSAQPSITAPALAFSAGAFLCISLSDLLPELQFHSHDRMKLSAALLIGLAAAYAIAYVETKSHNHQHGHAQTAHQAQTEHQHAPEHHPLTPTINDHQHHPTDTTRHP